MHPHSQELAKGTIIANMYYVQEAKKLGNLGSFVGEYCYVCEDLSSRDDLLEDDTIRDCLSASKSLQSLLRGAVAELCAGRGVNWGAIAQALQEEKRQRFFEQAPRSWWILLERLVQQARSFAEGAEPLRGAHGLRQLLRPAPLLRDAVRPRVFVKTFKKYDRQATVFVSRSRLPLCANRIRI